MKASNIGIIAILAFLAIVVNAFYGQYVQVSAEQARMNDYFSCKQSYMVEHGSNEDQALMECMK